jgi:hypothetical protein
VEELFVIGEEVEVNIEHPTLNIEVGEDEEAAFFDPQSAIHDLLCLSYQSLAWPVVRVDLKSS